MSTPCRCICGSGTVPFYRSYNPSIGDHFYTTNLAERDNVLSSWRSEGVACYVWLTQKEGTIPLYRLWLNGKDHFYTTSAAERDNAIKNLHYVSEGTACYVIDWQGCGTVPLYRLFNPGNGDHFYTTDAAERDNAIKGGYKDEGVAAYVFPVPH